jgi:hypothetical protein
MSTSMNTCFWIPFQPSQVDSITTRKNKLARSTILSPSLSSYFLYNPSLDLGLWWWQARAPKRLRLPKYPREVTWIQSLMGPRLWIAKWLTEWRPRRLGL